MSDALPPGIDPRLRHRAEAAAAWVREQGQAGRTVTVIHHIDADGVTAGAIALATLEKAGVNAVPLAVKSLDDFHIRLIKESNAQALWFCDLGSTAYMHFAETPKLVCDHHQLVRDGHEEAFPHVNPLLDGLDGHEISGAGCCYLVATALDADLVRLAPLALVGAAADRQDRPALHGTNALILQQAQEAGLAKAAPDLAFFGTQSRPLRRFLSLANEPLIPGLSSDPKACERLLEDAKVAILHKGKERTWSMLDESEKRRVRSKLANHLMDAGLAQEVPRLFRIVIELAQEPSGSPTRELQEFGTLLNSTARYDRPEIGLAVARGDRGAAYEEALDLLLDHRKHLVGALDALAGAGVAELMGIQWVHLEEKVRDTVIGIVCGMALASLGLRRDLVMVGLAWTPDGRTKISGRAPHELAGRVDLAVAMRDSAAACGGQGGGHPGAAGATVPRDQERAFVRALDRAVAAQLGRQAPAATSRQMVLGAPGLTRMPSSAPML